MKTVRTIVGHLGQTVARRSHAQAERAAAREAKRDQSRNARARLVRDRTDLSIRMAEGLGTDREAWLQGDVLVLWIGDRRYHFRRPGSFRREAILRTDPARIPAIARSVLE